ncbi:MAG: protein kinase [Isosphaeraceae bacterium]|nr:protein kinase [Isosphaeraceae bacterium]
MPEIVEARTSIDLPDSTALARSNPMMDPGSHPASEREPTSGDPQPVSDRVSAVGGEPREDPTVIRTGSSTRDVGSSRARGPNPSGSSLERRGLSESTVLPRPGDRVGAFVLEEAIGAGGMGAVFKAIDPKLDRFVALKLLPPEQARDPEAVQRFHQEGRAAARLDHDNIARVYSIGNDGGLHYIVFEFIEGTTIRRRVESDGILGVGEAIEITLQVAAALIHASARGVVHRDVKPSNIILTPEGRAKLVDMGLARRFERGDDTGLTQTGMYLGTFDYISPEQGRDPRDVDVRSDLYSLGCTLFFMLSGRAPFPDGNVVQKLMKHQEEPAPDLRSVNASVPPALAAIVQKLMAKERDRRHQTPDALVRDLLTLSADLGLSSSLVGRQSWAPPAPPPAWERHLVWAVPALAFVGLITVLVLNGLSSDPVSSTRLADEPAPRVKSPSIAPATVVESGVRDPASEAAAAVKTVPVPRLPREITIEAGDDLIKAIASAPPRSTLILADDGPYVVRVPARGESAITGVVDLTIKADLGARPVIRSARIPGTGDDRSTGGALIDLRGGRLVVEGVEFLVESGDRESPPAAIQVEDTELRVERCSFRRTGVSSESGGGRATAVRVMANRGRSGFDADAANASVMIDASHIDVGLTAAITEGPAILALRDTTVAPPTSGPTFEIRSRTGEEAATIQLRHVSLIAGGGPVFAYAGEAPRLRVDHSVIAASGSNSAVLLETDDPARVDWLGSNNLYGRVGVFVQTRRDGGGGKPAILDFASWSDDPTVPREVGSSSIATQPWAAADPATALSGETTDAARFFRLGAVPAADSGLGSRRSPSGPIPRASRALVDNPGTRVGPTGPSIAANLPATSNPRDPVGPSPLPREPTAKAVPKPDVDRPVDSRAGGVELEEDPAVDEMPEMPVMPPTTAPNREPTPVGPPSLRPTLGPPTAGTIAGAAGANTAALVGPVVQGGSTGAGSTVDAADASRSGAVPTAVRVESSDPARTDLIESAAAFVELLAKPSNRGENLRIPASADWELPAITLVGSGSWTIRAEAGTTRPRLRFRGGPDGVEAAGRTAWFRLQGGSLRVEGIDLEVDEETTDRETPFAVFAVAAGGDFTLADSTVTIEGERPTGSIIRVPSSESKPIGLEEAPLAASIRLKNSFLRSGSDAIVVEPGQLADIELDNASVVASGSLLRGMGSPRGDDARTLELTLRQVSARVALGVVSLESSLDRPELPYAEIVARNCVIATNSKGDPLVRLIGQDDPEGLRGRVHWDGNNVAYHKINTYRRDQVNKLGTSPTLFDRASWEIAVGPRESSPIHDDVRFVREWNDDRSPWTAGPEDLRLRADSPATTSGSGSDLSHVPTPPGAS